MATKTELLEKIDGIATGLDNISTDLNELIERVGQGTEGGLPAADVQEIFDRLSGIKDRVDTEAGKFQNSTEGNPETPQE